MQAVIFIGIPASGKTSFYHHRFFDTHVRLNSKLLDSPHRLRAVMTACIEAKQPFVLDDANLTRDDRRAILQQARKGGFRVVGYYFQSVADECLRRNAQRPPKQAATEQAIALAERRLEIPKREEGFDALYYVQVAPDGSFLVDDWAGS